MIDREKVIKGLESCMGDGIEDTPGCENCPYNDMGDTCERIRPLYEDALALLKEREPIEARLNLCESCAKEYAECEADKTDLVYGSSVGNDNIIGCPWYVNRWKAQEPIRPGLGIIHHDDGSKSYFLHCPFDGTTLVEGDKYCRKCGRAVKWG